MVIVYYFLFTFLLNYHEWNNARDMDYSNAIQDNKGQLLRLTLSSDDKYRIWTPLKNYPSTIIDAALLKEDRFFYIHPGFNPLSIIRSLTTSISEKKIYGASTVTMQLARLFWKLKTRSLHGKLKQILGAFYLETLFSKNQILELYLNHVPMGSNIEGIGAGSLIYFQKQPSDLNILESIALMEIPQSPNRKRLVKNRKWKIPKHILTSWLEYFPNEKVLHREKDVEIKSFDVTDLPFKAPHFTDYVIKNGLNYRTTLDSRLQMIMELQLKNYLRIKKSIGVNNGAALLVETRTGKIKSMIGSANFFDPSIFGQVNGTTSKRSPGSTLKPLIYALAADQGLIHSHSLLYDIPQSFGLFDPENADRTYAGPISAIDALNTSRNVPAVLLNNQLKNPDLYDLLIHTNVTRLKEKEFYGHALGLGGFELTMLELTQLYRLLLFEEDLISPEASSLVYEMMSKNHLDQNFSYLKWVKNDLKIAWKTGTSHGFRDAWTIGLVGPYTLVVWLGNFDGSGNPAFVGRDLAAPLFFDMVNAMKAYGYDEIKMPSILTSSHLKKEKVCSLSGNLPTHFCPYTKDALFIPGKSSIMPCSLHQQVAIHTKTGLRQCIANQETELKIYEFWPTQILEILNKAGFKRKTPPDFEKTCSESKFYTVGINPQIISPRPYMKYIINGHLKNTQNLALKANAHSDVKELYWFLNNEFIGGVNPEEAFTWGLKAGKHQIKVIDDHGRYNQTEIEVQYQL